MNEEFVQVALTRCRVPRQRSNPLGQGGLEPSLPVRTRPVLGIDVVQVRCQKIQLDIVHVPLVQGRIAINVPRRGGGEHRRRTARRQRAAGSDRTSSLSNHDGY